MSILTKDAAKNIKEKKNNYFYKTNFLKKIKKKNINKNKIEYPKISIVMPSFNQGKFIEQSILSIINQQYPNLQLIIIDGGSTDETIDIIKKYENYVDYWVSESDKGQSDALNKGFKKSNGDFFGWLNSDDLYLPGVFFLIIDTFKKNPKTELVFGDWLSIDKKNNIIDLNHAFDFNLNHFRYEGFHLNAQSMLWKSSLHKKFSGFFLELYNTMDYQMILEFGILSENNFLRIPNIIGAFRRHENQKTGPKISNQIVREHYLLAKRFNYQDKFKLIGKFKRHIFRYRRAYWYIRRGGLKNLFERLFTSLKYRIQNK